MTTLYLLVNESTNIIQQATYSQPTAVPSGDYAAMVDDSVANAQTAIQAPTDYVFQSGSITRIPYFTAAYDGTTLTATLNSPGTTPPASAAFVVGASTVNAPIAQGTDASGNTVYTAKLTVSVHPSLAKATAEIEVSAAGCKSLSINVGGTGTATVGLQLYQTATAGDYQVAPVGAGSKTFLEGYYALSAASLESLLADIATATNLLTDVVFNVLLPQAQAAAFAPVTLSADQANALTDVKANVLPNVYTTLANAYPSGGTKQVQYGHYVDDLAKTFKNFEAYNNDLNTIPGLAV